jgi:hypothetical protein
VPEDRAVSDVDAVEPLNLVRADEDDDDDTLLLRLKRQLLRRERGSRRLATLPTPLEVTDRALCLRSSPPRELASGSPNGTSPSDKPLGSVDSPRPACFVAV